MLITVKLFAILRERSGLAELQIELPDPATVADARQTILQKLPELEPLLKRVAFAVNRSYANTDAVLQDGDELALIPPVSGGW
jgi:molybdopterin converting factor subunit 1